MSFLSRLDKPNRVWFALSTVLVLVIAALLLGLVAVQRASDAKDQGLRTANCVNTVLALRQTPAAQDSAVTAELFSAIDDLLAADPGEAADKAYAQFKVTLAKDKAILNKNQAFRKANPLGAC